MCSIRSKVFIYRFPTEKNRRCAWIKACKIDENIVRPSSLISSKHVKDDEFDSSIMSRRTLIPSAIPSPSGNYFRVTTITRNPLEAKIRQNVEESPQKDVFNTTLSRTVNISREEATARPSKENIDVTDYDNLKLSPCILCSTAPE